jgi:hypothetical protein
MFIVNRRLVEHVRAEPKVGHASYLHTAGDVELGIKHGAFNVSAGVLEHLLASTRTVECTYASRPVSVGPSTYCARPRLA